MQTLKHLMRVGLLIALVLITNVVSSSAAVYAPGGGQKPGIHQGLGPIFLPLVIQNRMGGQEPGIHKGLGPFIFKGDLRKLPKSKTTIKRPQELLPPAPLLPGRPQNPALSPVGPQAPTVNIPSPFQDFDGMAGGNPPDTNGVVGPNHYIQTINVSFQVWNKAGTSLAGPIAFTTLFNASPATGTPCDNGFTSDPVVLYDAMSDRFVLTILAFAGFKPPPAPPRTPIPPFYECIAVSKTNDPVSGGWLKYVLMAHSTDLNDFPKLGVWPDAYYMSANMNGCCGGSTYVRAWALKRDDLVNGVGLFEQHFDVQSGYNSLLPSNLHGTLPPTGEPSVFAAIDYNNNNKVFLWNFHVDWGVPANSTFGVGGGHTPDHTVNVTAYTHLSAAIPQPGPGVVFLDPIGDRADAQAQYRRIGATESLWINHPVDTGSNVSGIRWYEIRDPSGSPTAFQEGTFNNGGDGINRWMGSLAADRFGNMAVGYNVANSSIGAGIRSAGRLITDPAGTLAQGEATLINGSGTLTNCTPISPATTCTGRWGDYSGMSVDPVDDCTFWFTGEYVSGGNNRTRIGAFRLPGCDADLSVNKTGPSTAIAGTDLTYNLTVANNGPVAAQSIALADTVPANTTFVSWTQNTGAVFACTTPSVGTTGTVNCSMASMANGASATFTFVAHISPSAPDGSTLSNTANVSTTSNDPNSGNNSSTVNSTVITSADLAVDKTATTDPVIGGTNETYNLTITNNGPSDAQAVSLTDATPSNTTFVSELQNTGPAFTCSTPAVGGTGTMTCTIAKLPAGASATFSFVVHVSPSALDGSTLLNTVSASSSTSDPNPGNNSKTITTAMIARADLSITKSQAASLVIADTNQTYTLAIVNNGPSDAQNVTLTDATPANTTFVSWMQNTDPTFTCATPPSGGTGNVGCSLATLPLGASTTFTMAVRISPVDVSSISNTGSVASSTIDPNPSNNSSTVTATDSLKAYKKKVLTDLATLRSSVSDKQDGQKLDDAIKHLTNSLAPSLWLDGNTLAAKVGDQVFSEEKNAVVKLTVLIKHNSSGIGGALQEFVDRLITVDHALADIAIHQAINASGDPRQFALAQNELTQGDNSASAGKYTDGIEHYRNAWQHAQQAMRK